MSDAAPENHANAWDSVAVDRSGLLAPQLLALVYLRVSLINGCPF